MTKPTSKIEKLIAELCPEVGTSFIVLRSSRSDKYDRYLADIFIPQGKDSDPATDVYLNNLLLEKGYAGRV